MSVKILFNFWLLSRGTTKEEKSSAQATSFDRTLPQSEKLNADNYGNMAD
jgi:hypothetical protein